MIEVRLSTAATFDVNYGDNPSVDIPPIEQGRYAGFLLARLPLVPSGTSTLFAARFSSELGGGYEAEGAALQFSNNSRTVTLPTGDYLIALLTDGQQTTMTLRFGGLDGSVSISPTESLETVVHDAVSWGPSDPSDHAVSIMDEGSLGAGGGVVFQRLAYTPTAYVTQVAGRCWYPNATTVPQPAAYAPVACKDATFKDVSYADVGPDNNPRSLWFWHTHDSRPCAVEEWFASASVLANAAGLTVWVPFPS